MDMNNFNLLKSEFANLTSQLKSSLEATSTLAALSDFDIAAMAGGGGAGAGAGGTTTTTLTSISGAPPPACLDFTNKLSSGTTSLFETTTEKTADSTSTLLNSINNLKKVANCTGPAISEVEKSGGELTWVMNNTINVSFFMFSKIQIPA